MRASRKRFPRPASTIGRSLALVLLTLAAPVAAENAPDWVARSDAHAQIILDMFARFNPEMAGQFGVSGVDENVLDLRPGFFERQRAAGDSILVELRRRLDAEADPRVKQDLLILIDAVEENREDAEVNRRLVRPFFSVTSTVYQGMKALLDDQVPSERRQAALVRLNRYAGLESGYAPIATLAQDRIRERMLPELLPPVKAEVEKELNDSKTYVEGIKELCEKYGIQGYEEPYAVLQEQLAAYDAFVREEILPTARTDFRQPEELYRLALRQYGNKMPVPEMVSRATVSFKELQNQMQCVAVLVAKERGWDRRDYRDVIRELKKDQLVGEAILPFYQKRLEEVEAVIVRERICTLPDRKALIKLSSAAEAAAIPAPHMQPPRLIGNTGEMGTFVLPLTMPGEGGELKAFDDFTFEAASWTLTAHEARPGHELQFAKTVENGVSLARGIFSLNSVNVEGWGLYAEAELQPYEPLEGQLIALQHRLLRAGRAFLDPGLQLGTITREEAMRILREDVVLSEAMATQEVQRYTFLAPGQAPSYFVGYNRLLESRAKAERALGGQFDRTAFNDFVLAQGLLPVDVLDKAVEEEFIPRYTTAR